MFSGLQNFSRGFIDLKIAALIIFLITSIYLFPAFLGKIDTAIDIRDVRMYPWRYYAIDKKLEVLKLWENTPSVFNLKVLPNNTTTTSFKISLDKSLIQELPKLKDSNYNLSFYFKVDEKASLDFDFGAFLVNNLTGEIFKPNTAVLPILGTKEKAGEENPWYKAYFSLNAFVKKIGKIEYLNNYSVQIKTKNKSKTSLASMYIKELKLECEDCSKVIRVHNHYNNDLIQMFSPFREYYGNALKKFRLPFWINHYLCGHEFLAEPQIAYFHPLYLVSYFLFDHFTAHQVVIFISLFLCGFGAFLLANYWGLSLFPSLLTAIVYMFQPFNVTWLSYGHMILNCTTLPFLLLCYEKNLKEEKFLNKYLLFTALLLGLIFISGHLQYINYTIIFFFLFVLFRAVTGAFSNPLWKRVLSIVFIFVFALMIGAIEILPFLPVFQNSHRVANPESFIRFTSIPLKSLLGLIYPYYGGYPEWPIAGVTHRDPVFENFRSSFFRNYVYFGFLPFLFSLFSFKVIFTKRRNVANVGASHDLPLLVIFFFFIIIFSFLVAMGSPIYFWIKDIIPGFRQMQHHRFTQLYSYSVPFLVGIGSQIVFDYLLAFKRNIINSIKVLVIVLVSVDLMFYSSYFLTWSSRKDYKPIHKGGVLEFIKKKQKESKEPFRVLPFVSHKVEGTFLKNDIAEPNALLPYGIEEVSGYSSFIPKDIYYIFFYIQTKDPKKLYSGEIFDLFSNVNTPYPINNFHSKILDLLNVKYFIVPNFLTIDSSKVKLVFDGDCKVYENKAAFARAFFVPNYKIIESPKDTIVKLDSERFDGHRDVILRSEATKDLLTDDTTKVVIRSFGSGEPQDDIQFLKYEPENITLKVETNVSGFLVLGHNLNNNWKVKINGKEAKHFQANLVQRAVYLPKAGSYLIEFYYFSKLFCLGTIITCIGVIVLLLLALYLKFSNKANV